MNESLPLHVRDLLGCCPEAGAGVNNWLFRIARALHPYRRAAEIEKLLAAAVEGCGRVVATTEIARAVQNSCRYKQAGANGQGTFSPGKWPKLDLAGLERVIVQGPRLVDLWERSPFQLVDNDGHTEEIVDILFPDNPLLCIGKSNREFDTLARDEWRGQLGGMSLLVPSPMSARIGITQEGKTSAHTLANTGPRRFLVIECDFSKYARNGPTPTVFAPLIERLGAYKIDTLDMGSAVLAHLAQEAPLALAVHSGGKSLHGWFYCAGQDENRLKNFMATAVTLGADHATWTRSQFVRMPDGLREDGKQQPTYYLNPRAVK